MRTTSVKSIRVPPKISTDLNVALVSMPWRRPNNAAIGLASLKAAALHAGAGSCDVYYLNDRWFSFLRKHGVFSRELEGARYSEFARVISELAGVIQSGEWVFSRCIFSNVASIDSYSDIFRQASSSNEYAQFAQDLISNAWLAEPFLNECMVSEDWNQYDVIGLSCVFYQLSPSLAFAKLLRDQGYMGKLVLGGPLCEGLVGRQILTLFPFLDAVFDGEAELSFPSFLSKLSSTGRVCETEGMWYRDRNGVVAKGSGMSGIDSMDMLPTPDYSDFFEELDASGQVKREEVAFPIEASRGCWWGQHHHCIFCGLNGADMTYRAKSPEKIYSEICLLHKTYGLRHFAFTDNIVSPKFMRPLMRLLRENPIEVTFHAEIKSNLSRMQIQEYRSAGFIYLQPGIESLSSNVLRIMNKGVTALANIACLKFCREAGITPFWNLLHGFPGEIEADYQQTRSYFPAISHLHPPEVITAMRLTRFSPSFDRSSELGFMNCRPARFYQFIYPYTDEVLTNLVNSFEFDYVDNKLDRTRHVEDLAAFIQQWKSQSRLGTLVFDRCGGIEAAATIYDSRFTRVRSQRHLDEFEAWLYILCDSPIELMRIIEQVELSPFSGEDKLRVSDILMSFVDDLLMLREGDFFLSLAVHDSTFIPWQAIGAIEQIDHIDNIIAPSEGHQIDLNIFNVSSITT